ncbi:MAG: hypothetical protein K8M05_01435 [Deltaproteobacteria bacterium]|nr:hypothetical protein [Kofleriaceae bacterium]
MRPLFVCVVLLAACKGTKTSEGTASGSGTAAEGSGSAPAAPDAAVAPGSGDDAASAAAEVKRPKEVADLETTLVTLLNEPESDERSKKTCDQFMQILAQARAVANLKPAGVDAAAWDEQGSTLVRGFGEGLAVTCKDDPPDDSVELANIYKEFQALVALLPK